ncbi:hypothetical protein BDY24DRAFT_384910 [Mrakia frigida]|uniref:uncharacterized protein n=1 Tax=Mrakia frigida TaxID=29902 RepID=UPI003FCC1655
MSPECHSCGGSNLVLSDTFGESVCADCGVVASNNSLVHREVQEGADTFYEGSTRLGGNGLGNSAMYGGGRFQDKEGNKERGRQQRLELARNFMSSLVRLFNAKPLEARAMFLYEQSDARKLIFTDRIKYVASAAFALVAREKKRQETLKDIAHAADLSLIRLSRVYVKLQSSAAIGVTEVDPLVYIERHILHLQNICKDPSVGLVTNTWETKGRGKDLMGTLQHLQECDLRAVRKTAIRLSEFFHDIYLFAGRHAMSVSIAIITVAVEGTTKMKLSRAVDIPEELSRVNNVASWTVMERYREAGKMFLDWAEYLPGVDLSVRDIVPAGKNSKQVKRRLCRRREIAIITTEVLDQWQDIRDRRVALGLEKQQPMRTAKISELPPVAPTLQDVAAETASEGGAAGDFKEKMARWGASAAVGEDAHEMATWNDIDLDEEDWSDTEDPLGETEDGEVDEINNEPVPTSSRAPSPPPTNAVASSSQVRLDGPSTSHSSSYDHRASYDQAPPGEVLSSNGYQTALDEFSKSYSSPSPSSNHDVGGSSLAMDPSLLNPNPRSHIDPSLLDNSIDPSLRDDRGQHQEGLVDYPYPSPSRDAPPSAFTSNHVNGLTQETSSRNRSASVVSSSDASSTSDPHGNGPPVVMTKKGKPAKIRRGKDPRFLRYTGTNTADVMAGRKALPALIAYKPSLPPVAGDAPSGSPSCSSSATITSPAASAPPPPPATRYVPPSFGTFPPSPASTLAGGGASDAGTDGAAISNRVVIVRKDATGVRPPAYMRHRPSDVMRHHPYVHLKPAVIKSIRESGEPPKTELAKLIINGHTLDDLPIHLAPTSNLGAIAALRVGGVDEIQDDELFVEGELEGYVRPDEEREFVGQMWEDEGKWEGLEEIIALREKRERNERERDARRLERAERRAANGGRYTRSKKTKVTKDMVAKLAALAAREDDGGEGDIASLMKEYGAFGRDEPEEEGLVSMNGGGPSGSYGNGGGSDDDDDKSDEKHDEKHDSDDSDDQYSNGRPTKRSRTMSQGIGAIDPSLLGPSGFDQAQADREQLQAGMEMLNAVRAGDVEEDDEGFGAYE